MASPTGWRGRRSEDGPSQRRSFDRAAAIIAGCLPCPEDCSAPGEIDESSKRDVPQGQRCTQHNPESSLPMNGDGADDDGAPKARCPIAPNHGSREGNNPGNSCDRQRNCQGNQRYASHLSLYIRGLARVAILAGDNLIGAGISELCRAGAFFFTSPCRSPWGPVRRLLSETVQGQGARGSPWKEFFRCALCILLRPPNRR
jgi:hypothetical protein